MPLITKTIETTGFVNAQHQLLLNEPLPIASSHVRVIIMVAPDADTSKEFKTAPLNYDPDTIDTLCGAFKNSLSSSDDFAQRKEAEIKLEEAKWQRK